MFIDEVLKRFVSWELLVTAIAIAGLFTTVKLMFKRAQVGLWEKPWFQGFVMTPMNLVLGSVAACIPDWFPGDTYFERLVVGLAVGFLSLFLYTMFKKRVGDLTGMTVPASDDSDSTAAPTKPEDKGAQP